MCLYVKSVNDFKKAAEDIPCWKILEYGHAFNDRNIKDVIEIINKLGWYTPFAYLPVNSDTIVPEEDTVQIESIDLTDEDCLNGKWEGYKIDGGVIHCYNNYEDAKSVAGLYNNCFVFEAIIPKGTEYIEGSDTLWGYINNYGSKCVKIIDPIFLDSISTGEPPKL